MPSSTTTSTSRKPRAERLILRFKGVKLSPRSKVALQTLEETPTTREVASAEEEETTTAEEAVVVVASVEETVAAAASIEETEAATEEAETSAAPGETMIEATAASPRVEEAVVEIGMAVQLVGRRTEARSSLQTTMTSRLSARRRN